MKWTRFGISLTRLNEEHLELVRHHRNDPAIRKYMEFQDEITPEMQLKWFQSINNNNNFYYLIEVNNDKIGLIHNKNVDWNTKKSESGIFIWDRNYLSTYAPLYASLCFCEIGFYIFQGSDSIIKIRKDNTRAIEYNKQLGFELFDESGSDEFSLYKLTKENFEIKSRKFRLLAIEMNNHDQRLYLDFDEEDRRNGTMELFMKYYTSLPFPIYELQKDKSYYFEIKI